MSNNHLFIGLGGTGGNIIREIRKHVHVRSAFFEKMEKEHGLSLDYLYIDSNKLELDSTWLVLGRDVSLPPNQRKNIHQVNITQLLDNAKNMPAILPWLGGRNFISNIVGGMAGTPGANQRRRFGRLLFSTAASDILSHITSAVQELERKTGQRGVNFHLLGTLGGGTGSGSIVDMALMLRSTYNRTDDEEDYPINSYVLVTDNPGAADVGYFFQNQYSALCDLNRLLASKNVNFELLTDPLGQKYNSGKALKHCYIVTDKSESGRIASKEAQEKTLADWLLQTTSMLARNNNPSFINMFKAFTGEDVLPVHPGESDDGGIGHDRSYAFSSLGIMHWMSPEEQIKEQAANALTHDLLLGICYSNYRSGYGHLDKSLTANSQDYLSRHPYKDMGCELGDICAETEGGFTRHYRDICKNIAEGARAAKQARETVDAVEKLLESEWKFGFADCGVENFYTAMSRPNEMDKNVEAQIHRFLEPLQEAFFSGKLGIADAWDVIIGACAKVDDVLCKITATETERQSLKYAKTDCDRHKKICEIARDKFCNAGFFAPKKRLMMSYIIAASDYYAARTRVCAYEYAGKYLQKLKSKFDSLSANVKGIYVEVKNAIDDLNDKINTQQNTLNQLSKVGSNKYVFHPQRLEDFVANAKQDALLLDTVRKEMIKLLFGLRCDSNQNGLNYFDTKFKNLKLAGQCGAWGDRVREQFEKSSGQTLCPGILEALYSEMGNNPNECKKRCHDFMKEADVLLQIARGEPQPCTVTGTDSAQQMPKKSILIEIPMVKDPNLTAFTKMLKDHLRNSVFNVPPGNVYISETDGNESEIAVTVCVSWMAARFASCLSTLKKKYDKSLAGNEKSREQVLYFCHLDDDYAQRENLFLPTTGQIMRRFELMIKMGKLLGVIREHNGNNVIIVTENDIPRAEVLCPILLDNTPANKIKGICEKLTKQLHDVQDGKERIHEIFKQKLEEIGDPLAPAYNLLLDELDEMVKLL